MHHMQCYKKDYPRPQLVRDNWVNLNGKWDFAFDRDDSGEGKGYFHGFDSQTAINVPFAYQTKASGIGVAELCENIWYQRTFSADDVGGGRLLLHLEGSDYLTKVWVNGIFCGSDTGAYHRLTFDITSAVKQGDNLLVVKVYDSYSRMQPRGKQRAEDHDYGCWYIDTSGIYKTVWLEYVPDVYITSVRVTPSLADQTARLHVRLNKSTSNALVCCTAAFGGKTVAETTAFVEGDEAYAVLNVGNDFVPWEVGKGGLYDLSLALAIDGNVVDKAASYFGMREISVSDGKILLNGKPLYQRLVLDQGYWQDTDITPPDEEALKKDIDDCIAMGFNGCRKHEKVEDERFLYYADLCGYIVWAEMPSVYDFDEQSRNALMREWKLAVEQQYNHPCVLVWVPFNESWGVTSIKTDVEQQQFVNQVYLATKQIDPMRPVICNDGWEHTMSDILTIHHYTQDGAALHSYFDTIDKCVKNPFDGHDKGAFADGYTYRGQPVMITEFGGTSFVKDTTGDKWGYGQAVKDDAEYLARLDGLVGGIVNIPFICGFCYTQVSDVYHEVNGLLAFDRTPKESFDKYHKIFAQPPKV